MRAKLKILLPVVFVTLIFLTVTSCNDNNDNNNNNNHGNNNNGTTPAKIVCIDPGHGGSDPGTLGWDDMVSDGGGCEWKYDSDPNFPNEADINLDIALKLNTILRDQDFKVVMTRTTDIDVSKPDRVDEAKRENCDIFVSMH